MTGALGRGQDRAPAPLRALLSEIGDLKRIRSANRTGSIAERGFRQAWAALFRGDAPDTVMRHVVAAALAAARLGDCDATTLQALSLSENEAHTVLARSFDAVTSNLATGGLDAGLLTDLRSGLSGPRAVEEPVPLFVDDLAHQPRAGATCPDKPRLVLEPPENHAEHCWAVAVFGVLLSPAYGADPVSVFLASLAHHLHNATMPDSGFTGEMLLGSHLDVVIAHANNVALAQLPEGLRRTIEAARRILGDAETPEGRAFHAADVIDRVMQIAQHLRPASISMTTVLDELELVHAGPVKAFHDGVLAQMGLP